MPLAEPVIRATRPAKRPEVKPSFSIKTVLTSLTPLSSSVENIELPPLALFVFLVPINWANRFLKEVK
jgi:hypothetical protein